MYYRPCLHRCLCVCAKNKVDLFLVVQLNILVIRDKLLCALATRHNCIIKLLNAKQIFVYMFQKQTQVDMFIKQGSLACGHVCQVYKCLKPNDEWKVEGRSNLHSISLFWSVIWPRTLLIYSNHSLHYYCLQLIGNWGSIPLSKYGGLRKIRLHHWLKL